MATSSMTEPSSSSSKSNRKKVDPRIRTMLENGAKSGHRSFMVMIGDRGKEQVANLHYMLSKAQVAKRPSVLWCFKKELEFSSHRKKRMKQLKKASKGIKREAGEKLEDDPFELFLNCTNISYCYYHESDRILGNTFGMCILQDFEALTPNLLARTIETVQGGGLVVLLLKTLTSLKQLYTMTMDVHARYRTESLQNEPVARFNERFLLSLSTCSNCLVVNDQLDVLPVTSLAAREIQPIQESSPTNQRSVDLEDYKMNLLKKHPDSVSAKLVSSVAKTMDQAIVVKELADILSSQPLRTTISLTAGRGRGKSAALGLALASALSAGYANIFITSPSPENLKTVFEFLFKGLDVLGYEEHMDYDVIQSTQPELAKCIVRVNVHKQKQHRQTILYIQPEDAHLLGQAELVAVDEAAAIPLPLVQALTSGPQAVIMSSTINGYEGTGRSLSLKLLTDLRKPSSNRTLKELSLDEPIRYSCNDPVEQWLNKLLCLDVNGPDNVKRSQSSSLPHPDACQLYVINRDTLFSYHKAAESFLQRLINLYVSSHYKNSPNDLQLMSDAPGHILFVLLPPGAENLAGGLPEILCFVQVCLEGQLSKQSVVNNLSRGKRAAGDLIPWTVSQQFQDDDFAQLSGARIVRIAVNPEYQKMGYGSRAMKLVELFFKAELLSAEDAVDHEDQHQRLEESDPIDVDISKEIVKPRTNLRPLLTRVDQVRPLRLHWLGVSFGLTGDLWKFYKRLGYRSVYLRQTTNDITGEHTTIVLKQLLADSDGVKCSDKWLPAFNADFIKRFISLLSFNHFKRLPISLCLSLLEGSELSNPIAYSPSPFDLKRLESYSNNLLDYHMITDLLPDISRQYFCNSSMLSLSPVQSAILLAMGLQRKTVEEIEKELALPVSQILAMFSKVIRKYVSRCREEKISNFNQKVATTKDNHVAKQESAIHLPELEEELEEAANDAQKKLKRKQKELVDSLDLAQYEIDGDEVQWTQELDKKSSNLDKITVSISSNKPIKQVDASKSLFAKHIVDAKAAKKVKSKKLKH